jgi:hypothetical protein
MKMKPEEKLSETKRVRQLGIETKLYNALQSILASGLFIKKAEIHVFDPDVGDTLKWKWEILREEEV